MYKNIIVQTSDIHLCESYYKYIEKPMNEFIDYIINNKPRYVVIAGDYFDRRINSDESIYSKSIGFLIKISEHCGNLIVINGTYNHDYTTLKILNEISKIKSNIHYINTLSEKIIDNKKFLLIPEEYPENPEEYYSQIYQNKYDYIIGHGELEGTMLHSGIDNRKLKGWKFNVHKLESTGALWNMWGHIHLPQNLTDKTFYSGSLSRYKFNEEEEKGFSVMNCDEPIKEFVILKSNLKLITYNEEILNNFDSNEKLLSILKNENTFIRFKGDIDSKWVDFLKNESINEVFTIKDSQTQIELTIDNFLLYKDINDISLEEQFMKILEKDILKLTKAKKLLLESEGFKTKLNFLISNIEKQQSLNI